MTNVIDFVESPIVSQLHPVIEMTDDQFFEFCQLNRDLRIERTANGELSIMLPAGSAQEIVILKLASN
uniref:Uma2 family endonuclease n=1 Tax=Chroococcidiopsis sp. TS-821 TaxID=1378066 RepID=UPI001AEF4A77|nr:Uma2 family endonuclease [Chroococcidiopsis sp. TS-821]